MTATVLKVVGLIVVVAGPAWAATDYIQPGTPSTVGRSGSILGSVPEHPVPAPRGAMGTLGLPAPTETAGPARGANSFSAAEAKRRIEAGGFSQVTGLAKDGNGVWRGSATRNGSKVSVFCDYKGTVGAS